MIVFYLLIGHWFASLSLHSIFLHRYSSHRMFTMSKFWERVFYFGTFLVQGTSFLNPRAYAILHRMHHTHSDDKLDPHSPHHHGNVFAMMMATYKHYRKLLDRDMTPEERKYSKDVPEWDGFDRIVDTWWVRILFLVGYMVIYYFAAAAPWQFFLFPLHLIMGPLQGAMVNWCGHKYGYVNFKENGDKSRNTLLVDVFGFGELFQNNHHKFPGRPNFAYAWFEVDVGYWVMMPLRALGIIRLRNNGVGM